MSKAKAFVKENLVPRSFKDWQKAKEHAEKICGENTGSVYRKEVWKAFAKLSARRVALVAASAAIYQATAATYGVSSRDSQLSFSAGAAWNNASSLSLTVSAGVVAMIPPTMRESVSRVIIPLEVATAFIRMVIEQKLWKKHGVTPDPAGTLLTPALAFGLECAWKAAATYPTDAESRLMVGMTGIYGNLTRIVNAVVMSLAIPSIKKALDKTAIHNSVDGTW